MRGCDVRWRAWLLIPTTLAIACGGSEFSSAASASGATDSVSSLSDASAALDDCPAVFGDQCQSVWPWFAFQQPAATTTGIRNDLVTKWFPVNGEGLPLDVAPYNLRDGVSPVTPVVILPPRPLDPALLPDETRPDASLMTNSPTVMVDAQTGKRIRHIAELDLNAAQASRQALILRPYGPMGYGRKIVVSLTTGLLGKDGLPMPSTQAFAELKEGKTSSKYPRLQRFWSEWQKDVITMEQAGIPRAAQVATWHFTTASADWVTGPAVELRQQFLAKVGSAGLGLRIASIEVDPDHFKALPNLKATPLPNGATVTVKHIHQDIALRIQGEFELPNAMSKGQSPESTLNWPKDGSPKVQLQTETLWRSFALVAGPKALQSQNAPPLTVYGHGFLRTICKDFCINAALADPATHLFAGVGAVGVGTDWWGLSELDIGTALGVSNNFSLVPRLTDKLVHSALSFIPLSRAIQAKVGSDPRFAVQTPGSSALRPLTDPELGLRYTGNSLGGIMGTTMVALHPDVERAVVNVAGGVWSTMMNRSSNFATFLVIVQGSYPDPFDQQVLFALMQSHWDLSDPVHFAPLVAKQPLAGTRPNRRVLWPISWGDSQVPALASSMLARGAGAPLLGPTVAKWPDVPTNDEQPYSGQSSFVQWDSQRGTHPPGNASPAEDNMSHYATRWMPEYWEMVSRVLYGDGKVEQRYCLARDTDGALPCTLTQEIAGKAAQMAPVPPLPPPEYK